MVAPESLCGVTTFDVAGGDQAARAPAAGSLPPGQGSFAGVHVLAELGEMTPEALDDVDGLRTAMRDALTQSGATVLEVLAHRFQPAGVTVLAMLAESHASIHTYPEIGAAFVDVFTCGRAADPELAVRRLAAALEAGTVTLRALARGGAGEA